MILFIRCADSDVAVFRATNSGCSEPHSASEMRTFSLSPLPDRSGRKLVGDWGGTTHVSFRFGWMLLVNGYTIPYTSAETSPTKGARSRTLQIPRTSQPIQKLPCTATAVFKTEKNLQIKTAVAVQGSSGRVREVWRVGRTPFKGSPCASKVFFPSPYLHRDFDE